MFKTKRTEFIVLTTALLVTRAVDAGLTFLITPDLRERFKSSRVRLGNGHIHPNLPD